MANPKTPQDLENLRALLERESYPTDFTLKFIGRNTSTFKQAVQNFEIKFPLLRLVTSRESSGGAHQALTYVFVAQSANEIIIVFEATLVLEDVLLVL